MNSGFNLSNARDLLHKYTYNRSAEIFLVVRFCLQLEIIGGGVEEKVFSFLFPLIKPPQSLLLSVQHFQ